MSETEPDPAAVRAWLTPARASSWRWSESGEAIERPAAGEQRTVAFRAELAEGLAGCLPRGLPPLPAVLRVIDLARDDPRFARLGWPRVLAAAAADLPVELASRDAEEALRALRDGLPVEWLGGLRDRADRASLRITDALARLTPERVEAHAAAGVPAPPAPPAPAEAEALTPEFPSAAALLTALADDPAHATLARLARDAGPLTRPFRPGPRSLEDTPAGFTGLSTRGPLDRLLLSELALDADVLAARVAHGEALRRHADPAPEPRGDAPCPVLLLDSGLLMWGTPRVVATALALAVAAAAGATRALARVGDRWIPVDLADRAALLHQLGRLETHVHLADGLPALPPLEDGETLAAVSAEEAWDDPATAATWRRVAAAQPAPLLVAGVAPGGGGGGRVQWRELSPGGSLVLHPPVFLEPRDAAQPARKLALPDAGPLPAALAMLPRPLRVPLKCPPERMFPLDSGCVVSVTRSGELLHGSASSAGPKLVRVGLPQGRTCQFGRLGPDAALVLVGGGPKRLKLVRVDAGASGVDVIDTGFRPSADATGHSLHRREIYEFSPTAFRAVDAESGTVLATLPHPPRLLRHHGRLVEVERPKGSGVAGRHWATLARVGSDLSLDAVGGEAFAEKPLLCLDLPDRAGTLWIDGEGFCGFADTDDRDVVPRRQLLPPGGTARIRGVEPVPDGGGFRVHAGVRTAGREMPAVVGFRLHPDGPVRDEAGGFGGGVAAAVAARRPIRTRWLGAALHPESGLALRGRRGWRSVRVVEGKLRLETAGAWQPADDDDATLGRRVPSPPAPTGVTLHATDRPLGPHRLRVFREPFGVLHLVPDRGSGLPEAMLIYDIRGDAFAGWLSDGRRFGDAAFHPEGATLTPAAEILRSYLLPLGSAAP